MIRFFQNTGKRLGLSLAFMATMLFSLSMPAFARDSISNINMIRIKVEERLRNLDPGDSLGNISEGDFSTGDAHIFPGNAPHFPTASSIQNDPLLPHPHPGK